MDDDRMVTEAQSRPVDTSGDEGDENHVACGTLDLTWCGQDAADLVQLPDPPPPLDTFCRVCVLAVEMHRPENPCPVCGGRACLG